MRIFSSFYLLNYFYMITFRKLYELVFKSFRIEATSHCLDELIQEQVHQMIIVKKSWIYGLFVSLIFILIIIVLFINIYFILIHYPSLMVGYLILWILIFTTVLGLYTGIRYLYYFRKLHNRDSILTGIHDIELIKRAIQKEEKAFISFFNQITASYLLMIFVTLFNIYYIIYLDPTPFNFVTIGEIFFFGIQIYLIHFYRVHMIILEMDCVIIIPNRVYFIDQIAIYKRNQTIKWVNNIRIISSHYQWFLGSIFNYGTIEIMIKGDTPALAITYLMHFVDQPIEVVNQMNMLIEPQPFSDSK